MRCHAYAQGELKDKSAALVRHTAMDVFCSTPPHLEIVPAQLVDGKFLYLYSYKEHGVHFFHVSLISLKIVPAKLLMVNP